MEIILVVVIMVIVTAIAIPVIRSMLTDSPSTAAGDQVRMPIGGSAFAGDGRRPAVAHRLHSGDRHDPGRTGRFARVGRMASKISPR